MPRDTLEMMLPVIDDVSENVLMLWVSHILDWSSDRIDDCADDTIDAPSDSASN